MTWQFLHNECSTDGNGNGYGYGYGYGSGRGHVRWCFCGRDPYAS